MAQQRGVVADEERRMIQSVFELGDTPAREVMVPRTEMVWIESDKTAGQATPLRCAAGTPASRWWGRTSTMWSASSSSKILCSRRTTR